MPVTLPAGFAIDTQLSPDRVRVQWGATTAPGAATLPNLGFESGDTSYIKGDGWAISTGGLVESGTQSAKFTGIGQSTIAHETLAPVTAGTSITASARISKGNNRQDFAGGAVVLQWFDNTLASLGFNVGNVVNTGTSAFQSSSVTANAPTGAAYVRLAASATRDVKGRATDAVTVDTLAWNHTFTLGGTGGGSTAPTGPQTFTFRVRDANGCEAVATRTIGQGVAPAGTWVFFGTTGAPAGGFFATTSNASSVNLSARGALLSESNVRGGGVFSGVFSAVFSGASNSFIRSAAATGPYTYPVLAGNPGPQGKIVRSGTRLVTIGGVAAQYSTNNGATWTATSGFFNFRVIAANSSGRLVAFRSVFTQVSTSTDGGDSWADVANISETTAGGIYDVVSDGSQFLLVYLDSSANVKCTRGNSAASTWEAPVTLPFTAPAPSSGFVAVNGEGGVMVVTNSGQASYSSNFGTTWSAVTSVGFNIVRSLAFGNGVFVVTGEAGLGDLTAAAFSSNNGATWARTTVTGSAAEDRITYAIFFPA